MPRRCARSSSAVRPARTAPGSSTTRAHTASPHSGSGLADDDDLGDPGHVLEDGLLDQAGRHLQPTGVDQVVDPAVDVQPTVLVGVTDVVGAEPAHPVLVDAERLGGQVGAAEVAVGDRGAHRGGYGSPSSKAISVQGNGFPS